MMIMMIMQNFLDVDFAIIFAKIICEIFAKIIYLRYGAIKVLQRVND